MNYRKTILLLAMVFIFGSGAWAQDFKYVGATKCKMCHNKPEKGEQFNKWAASPHAKAMASLKGDDAKNQKCLKCHSTASSVDANMLAGIPAEDGVSCESCHGPGSIYKSATIMKNRELAMTKGMIIPDEKVCKKCHNAESPNFKGFSFAEYSKKIAHDDPTTK
jgi:hypothetical protein